MHSADIRFCGPRFKERTRKRHGLIAMLVGIVMTAFGPYVQADLFVCNNGGHDSILRFDERTGEFLGEFVLSGSGGLRRPTSGLIFGPDGNLYVGSSGTQSILRYDGVTGDPLPSPGNFGATFVAPGTGGLTFDDCWFIFGPDGNLYVSNGGISAPSPSSSVLRFDGTTGQFLDTFVLPGSGGLTGPRGLVFGPDGNLYVNSSDPGPGSVLRYDGTTGAFLDVFVPAGSNPFGENRAGASRGLVFGPDGNLYVSSFNGVHPSVLRYDGTTGALIDAFVSEASGGLKYPTGPLFGPDGNLYIRSIPSLGGPGAVLRYDGATGAFIDQFVPYGSAGLFENNGFTFRNTDPTMLAYVPVRRLHITASSTADPNAPFDVTITALDSSGNIDTSYLSTVTFSTSDPNPGVVLPADYTFTTGDGADNGVHSFSGGFTLLTPGAQRVTVTDTVSGMSGQTTITVSPGP